MKRPIIRISLAVAPCDDAVRRQCLGVSAVVCMLALLLPAIAHADGSVGGATPVAAHASMTALSSEELGATSARGVPANSPSHVLAPPPFVRLWDEIGTPQGLPSQGTISITKSAGHITP